MKLVFGILSFVCGILSLYLMFFNTNTTLDFEFGYIIMLISIIFILMMIIEEKNEELKKAYEEEKNEY
jgi:hypothetical protein